MDFLRALAPSTDADTARAAAVLPARFSALTPLRASVVEPRRADADGDTEGAGIDIIDEKASDSTPTLAVSEHALPAPRDSTRVRRQTHVLAQPSEIGETHAHTVHRESARAAEPARRDAPRERPEPTAARQAGHVGHAPQTVDPAEPTLNAAAPAPKSPVATAAVAASASAARAPAAAAIAPLSEASVAQRALQRRDEATVVHVSIGRIDVVATANASPAPARHAPSARAPTVPLAEYLRAGKDRGR